MKPFATAVLICFLILGLFGVYTFATFSARESTDIGTVEVWGSVDQDVIDSVFTSVRSERDDFNDVTYKQVSPDVLVPNLVTAIASGKGPDLVILPSSTIVEHGNKLQTLTFDQLPRREFQDTYIDASDALITETGTLGLPLTVDPLVMYWNRQLFAASGVSRPPQYWDEVVTLAKRLTKRTDSGTIVQSTIALGTWENIAHNAAIYTTLVDQLGITPVVRTERGYVSRLNASTGSGTIAADSALRYWTDFADPLKPSYSWNRSQRNSQAAFVAGSLALYIGRASELRTIREANPNLDFDVAAVPSARGGGTRVEGVVTFASIPRGAANYRGALTVASILSSKTHAAFLAEQLLVPSARRDVDIIDTSDPFIKTFRTSALRSFVFLDPSPSKTAPLFAAMVAAVTSGRESASSAVRNAHDELGALLDQ